MSNPDPVIVLRGNHCEQHFVTARLLSRLAKEAGRTVVSVAHNKETGSIGRAAHDIASDWHDLNEGNAVTDLVIDLSQEGVMLCFLLMVLPENLDAPQGAP